MIIYIYIYSCFLRFQTPNEESCFLKGLKYKNFENTLIKYIHPLLELGGPSNNISVCSRIEIYIKSLENDDGLGIKTFTWKLLNINPFDTDL